MERFTRQRELGGTSNRERREQSSITRFEVENWSRYCDLMKRETNPQMRSLWGGMMALERAKAIARLQGLPEPTQNMINWGGEPINQPQPDNDPLPQQEPQN
jgi:hypothetical protein